jgi:hypothetical protein
LRPVSLLLPIDLVDVWRVVTIELSHAGFPADAIRSLLAPSEQPKPHRGDEARVRVKRHSIVESRLSCPRFVRRRCTSPASGSTPCCSCRCPRCATTEGLAAIRRARRRTSRLLSPRTRVANAPRDGLRVSRHDCASRLCALDSCDTQVPAFTLPLASATGSTVSTVGSCTLCAGLTPAEARRARSPGSPRERGAYRSRRESSRRHVGAAPAVTPVFSTDVCKPTIDGSKNGYPRRLGALRVAFPRVAGALGFMPRCSLRRAGRSREAFPPSRTSDPRASGASSPCSLRSSVARAS